MADLPCLEFADHSEVAHGVGLKWLTATAQRALPQVLAVAFSDSPLIGLREVEFTLVNDQTIARVHREFMQVSGATDVITFHHGEVLISVETAMTQALDYGRSTSQEVALYIIHGLLHLAGYKDKTSEEFETMAKLQEHILQACD